MTIAHFRALTLVCGLVLLAVGCGSSGPAITGQVTLDGQPLGKAHVSFHSLAVPGGAYTRAICDDQGRFVVEPDATGITLAPGKYGVTVSLKKDAQGMVPEDLEMAETTGVALTESVPTKYTAFTTEADAAFLVDIKPGKNDVKLDMKSQ